MTMVTTAIVTATMVRTVSLAQSWLSGVRDYGNLQAQNVNKYRASGTS